MIVVYDSFYLLPPEYAASEKILCNYSLAIDCKLTIYSCRIPDNGFQKTGRICYIRRYLKRHYPAVRVLHNNIFHRHGLLYALLDHLETGSAEYVPYRFRREFGQMIQDKKVILI